jgi:hypothetical protein
MDNLEIDRFYQELRKVRRELNEYRALPFNKRNERKLQKLKERYEALEEIGEMLIQIYGKRNKKQNVIIEPIKKRKKLNKCCTPEV